jgi:hypothetical protein
LENKSTQKHCIYAQTLKHDSEKKQLVFIAYSHYNYYSHVSFLIMVWPNVENDHRKIISKKLEVICMWVTITSKSLINQYAIKN